VVARGTDRFPLLVKYIDAEEALSVQVHPDDAYGLAHEGELGKTEMWYILHADPGADLIAGLRAGVTQDDFRRALAQGDPAELLHRVPVSTGDCLFIPAGRIHAIMPGVLILEIQQNSDTTYRLYDWGRLGLDGLPRPLHVAQAMAVTNWTDYAPGLQPQPAVTLGDNMCRTLAACSYFAVDKYSLITPQSFTTDGGSFHILNVVAGRGRLHWSGGEEGLCRGDSLLVPAAIRDFTLIPDEEAAIVVSSVP